MNQIDKVLTKHLPFLEPEQAIELCVRHWHDGEGLYQGFVEKRHISFDNSFAIIDNIESYFSNKKYEIDIDSLNDEDNELESFAKLVWLTSEYLSVGFREPLGIHYNPRLDINAIHSGGIRNQVLRLFHEGKVECLYFNTGGVQFQWMECMTPVDILDYASKIDVDVAVVADHGSLIPHIRTRNITERESVAETHKKIQEVLNGDFRVYSNVKIPALEPWCVSHPRDATLKIRLPSGYTTSDKLRAIIFAMFNRSYVGGY